jgi:hypothetical protein
MVAWVFVAIAGLADRSLCQSQPNDLCGWKGYEFRC